MEKVFINSYRKASQILLFSLISLALLVVSAFAARQLFQSWYSLAAGIFLMALAIPFHILGKRISSLYVISFLMNSVAAGFSVCTYYIVKNYPLNLETMMLAVFPAAGVLFLTVICFPPLFKSKKTTVGVSVVLAILFTCLSILFWVKTQRLFYSMSFFSFLSVLFYIGVFSVSTGRSNRNILRDISFGSFGSFIILAIAVSVLLSEGEVLGDAAPDIDLGSRPQKRPKGKHF